MGEEQCFGWALKQIKAEKMVYRKGWNGILNGGVQYLKLQVPDENSKMNTPYIYLTAGPKDHPHGLVPWVATQNDLLATDWEVKAP